MIVPYAPTPIRTRPYSLLNQLCARGHNITLVTLYTTADEQQSLNHWQALGVKVVAAPLPRIRSLWNVLRALPTPAPLQAVFCWQPILANQLTELLECETFDACHVEHLRGARYAEHVKRVALRTGTSIRIVWDSVDCISALFEQAAAFSQTMSSRMLSRVELGRTRTFEREMVGAFDATTVVTEAERVSLLELAMAPVRSDPGNRIHVVPNGVDTVYFTSPGGPRDEATILFSGKMSYHANLAAASFLLDQVMPRVWKSMPEAKVVVVGQSPPPSLLRRGKKDTRIQITGSVPDIRPFLERATVACAPMVYGVGVQNKILEAMAMELPVVASGHAVRALSVENGRELLVGANAEELSLQLLRVLREKELRGSLAQTAREFVLAGYRWQDSVEKLEALYQHSPN